MVWTSSTGLVAVYFNGNYLTKTCPSSSGHTVPAGGQFRLGGESGFLDLGQLSHESQKVLKNQQVKVFAHQVTCSSRSAQTGCTQSMICFILLVLMIGRRRSVRVVLFPLTSVKK